MHYKGLLWLVLKGKAKKCVLSKELKNESCAHKPQHKTITRLSFCLRPYYDKTKAISLVRWNELTTGDLLVQIKIHKTYIVPGIKSFQLQYITFDKVFLSLFSQNLLHRLGNRIFISHPWYNLVRKKLYQATGDKNIQRLCIYINI